MEAPVCSPKVGPREYCTRRDRWYRNKPQGADCDRILASLTGRCSRDGVAMLQTPCSEISGEYTNVFASTAPVEEANSRVKLRCLLFNSVYCLIVIHTVGDTEHGSSPTRHHSDRLYAVPTSNNIQPAQEAVRLQDCKTARRPGAQRWGFRLSQVIRGSRGSGQLQCGAHPDWHSSFSMWAWLPSNSSDWIRGSKFG